MRARRAGWAFLLITPYDGEKKTKDLILPFVFSPFTATQKSIKEKIYCTLYVKCLLYPVGTILTVEHLYVPHTEELRTQIVGYVVVQDTPLLVVLILEDDNA